MKRTIIALLILLFSMISANAHMNEVYYDSKFDKDSEIIVSGNIIHKKHNFNQNLRNNDYINFNVNRVYYGSKVENDELDDIYGEEYYYISDRYFNNRRYNGFERDENMPAVDLKYYRKEVKTDYRQERIDFERQNRHKIARFNKYNLEFRDSNFNNKNLN